MLRIMTVCTGNVCRSPLAEALLRARLGDAPVSVESAGIGALVDEPMTDETLASALARGVDEPSARAHRARLLIEGGLDDVDLTLAMAREHRAAVVDLAPTKLRSTFTLRELARLAHAASDAELAEAAASARGARQRLGLITAHLSTLRDVAGLPGPGDDDVPDPYRRGQDAYDRAVALIVPAVDEVARLVRIATARG